LIKVAQVKEINEQCEAQSKLAANVHYQLLTEAQGHLVSDAAPLPGDTYDVDGFPTKTHGRCVLFDAACVEDAECQQNPSRSCPDEEKHNYLAHTELGIKAFARLFERQKWATETRVPGQGKNTRRRPKIPKHAFHSHGNGTLLRRRRIERHRLDLICLLLI